MLSYLDRRSRKVASNTKGDWFNPSTNKSKDFNSLFLYISKPKEAKGISF